MSSSGLSRARARAYAPRATLTPDAIALRKQLGAAIERTGWSETARRMNVDRTTLHRCFGPSSRNLPNFSTVAAVAQALGLRLLVVDESFPL